MVLAACGGDEGAKQPNPTTTTTTTAPVPTTSTTEAPPTTVDLPPETKAEMGRAVFTSYFESDRQRMVSVLTGHSGVSSVDRFTFDPPDSLTLSVTSHYRSTSFVEDTAWELTRIMAVIWEPEGGGAGVVHRNSGWAPRLVLSVNEARATCPADFMLRLADKRVDRSGWATECR